jgi:hypothetical protein
MEFVDQDKINLDFCSAISLPNYKFDTQFDIQPPEYTDAQWANFDPGFDAISALYSNKFSNRLSSFNEVAPYDTIGDPYLTYGADVVRETPPLPPVRAESLETNGSYSTDDSHTLNNTLDVFKDPSGVSRSSSDRQRPRCRTAGAPYRLEDRSNHPSQKINVSEPEVDQTVPTRTRGSPSNAVFMDDSRQRIRKEMNLLCDLLRENQASTIPHHPALTCPVFDCEQGGWNVLLHGLNPERERPKGRFFTSNEVIRHVKTKHHPENDLRCCHPDCPAQAWLDASGKGRFSRVDVLRKHLKSNPQHKSSIPEELRVKYKLFKR